MPRGDGTGPLGQGPKTGRALGFCAGYQTAGYLNPVPGGREMAWGRGGVGGRGMAFRRGRGGWAPGVPVSAEPETLADQLNRLEQQLAALKAQLADKE